MKDLQSGALENNRTFFSAVPIARTVMKNASKALLTPFFKRA